MRELPQVTQVFVVVSACDIFQPLSNSCLWIVLSMVGTFCSLSLTTRWSRRTSSWTWTTRSAPRTRMGRSANAASRGRATRWTQSWGCTHAISATKCSANRAPWPGTSTSTQVSTSLRVLSFFFRVHSSCGLSGWCSISDVHLPWVGSRDVVQFG